MANGSIPRLLYMSGRERTRNCGGNTYIQNNFYGTGVRGSYNNIWAGYRNHVTMAPIYYEPPRPHHHHFRPSWLPGWAQNAVDRFMGFNLLQTLSGKTDSLTDLFAQQRLSSAELNEVNQRYTV